MWFHVVACDYDATLATAGRIAPETMAALRAVREGGRRLLLITGRELDDLLRVCGDLECFDLVVAENGAVLYDPHARQAEELAPPPPAEFLAALERAHVPFSTGRIIVSTVVPHEVPVLETIRALGLELQIVFNRESVMVLPSGVSKESGLLHALARLGVSPHNTVGIGDAENDHAFLARTGFAVAVENAVPALAEKADLVTAAPNGAGVREFLAGPLRDEKTALCPRLLRRRVALGTTADGSRFDHPMFGPNLLVTGDPCGGTSTLVRVFVDRLVRAGCVVCLVDPEGDHRTLADHGGIVVVSSEPGSEEGRAGEVTHLLRHRSTSVALDLAALPRAERVRATARFLQAVQRLRADTGAPHWVIIDEAHQMFPPGDGPAEKVSDFEWEGVCLVTDEPQSMAPRVLGVVRHVFSTSLRAVTERLPLLRADAVPGGELEPGEALSIALDPAGLPVRRFRVGGPR